jgi:hypothetical protein
VLLDSTGALKNTGQAAIVGVQLHAVVFITNNTKPDPVRETLLRNLTITPDQPAPLSTADNPLKPLEIPLSAEIGAAPAHGLSLILMAVGAGPGGVIVQDQRRFDNI